MIPGAEPRSKLAASATEIHRAAAIDRIDRLFEAACRRFPERPALQFLDQSLTYCELNERANQLAHYLCARGIGAGSMVALHVERSLDVVIGILGIIKAGGAYLPLDPGYPVDRLSYMLDDAAASLVVTRSETDHRLWERHAAVCLDDERQAIGACPRSNLDRATDAADLFYVIYTSGSTGRPKGVMVQHATVAHLFAASRSFMDFRETDSWSLFHSCSFGFSVWEMWGALLHGSRLIVIPEETATSPAAFFELVCRDEVSVLSQTPSAFRLFVEAESAVDIDLSPTLRAIVFSGEAADVDSLRTWIERHGDTHPSLHNTYALTETGGAVAHHRVTRRDLGLAGRSVIGHPLPHARIMILAAGDRPASENDPGEMYVGGDAVAHGYLNLPQLTAERFVDHPSAGRCYRTGDVARYLESGEVEFIGRDDHQIKILGFRIEPGEIEARLVEDAHVAAAVVVAREDRPGDKRLVAYLVVRGSHAPDPTALRAALRRHLPDYMIPNAFEILDELPRTPNGKVDRNALPAPDFLRRRADTPYRAPRNERQNTLVAIWREVLDVEQIGVGDDFLAIGGNSLLAMQVILRVFRAFGVDLPLRSMIEIRTIEELADVLDTIEWTRQLERAPAAEREEGSI